MTAELIISISNATRPAFIVESNFGVSDSTIRIIQSSVDGMKWLKHLRYLLYVQNELKQPLKYLKKYTRYLRPTSRNRGHTALQMSVGRPVFLSVCR